MVPRFCSVRTETGRKEMRRRHVFGHHQLAREPAEWVLRVCAVDLLFVSECGPIGSCAESLSSILPRVSSLRGMRHFWETARGCSLLGHADQSGGYSDRGKDKLHARVCIAIRSFRLADDCAQLECAAEQTLREVSLTRFPWRMRFRLDVVLLLSLACGRNQLGLLGSELIPAAALLCFAARYWRAREGGATQKQQLRNAKTHQSSRILQRKGQFARLLVLDNSNDLRFFGMATRALWRCSHGGIRDQQHAASLALLDALGAFGAIRSKQVSKAASTTRQQQEQLRRPEKRNG